MEDFIEKKFIAADQKIETEKDAFFQEIITKARENKKIAEEQWKEIPGEGSEWDLLLSSQFWKIWSEYDKEELKNKLPALWNKAVENYNKFVKEDCWDKAGDWEISEDNQFMHLIEEVNKEFRQKLEKLE